MNIYEASKKVREHVLKTTQPTTVQANGVYGISDTGIIKFRSEAEAIRLNGGYGFIFRTFYRCGAVDVTPLSA